MLQSIKRGLIRVIKFFTAIFTEPDGNGGKASFSRVSGAFVIIKIVQLSEQGTPVNDAMLTLFWVLIGYQLLSKTLNSLSPAVLDLARSWMLKAGAQITVPAAIGTTLPVLTNTAGAALAPEPGSTTGGPAQ
jgi:hypothetical protein